MNFQEAHQELKQIREDGGRDSQRVIELWNACVKDLSYKLGDEIWLIYEQVYIAALDVSDRNTAYQCLKALKNKFGDSKRVRRLFGLLWEYQEDFDQAKKLYDEMLNEDPSNTAIYKRLVAILKAQGRIPEAIKELVKYLEKFQGDFEAWGELCDLYISECEYKKAVFCMEELILSNPYNHLFHCKYAEIKYTEGGLENMEIARSYFLQSATFNENNLRALYGLLLSSTYIMNQHKCSSKLKKECSESANWASQRIALQYRKVEMESTITPIDAMIGKLGIEDNISKTANNYCTDDHVTQNHS